MEPTKDKKSIPEENEPVEELNRQEEILYEEKYTLYLGDDTSDLATTSINNNCPGAKSAWDDV